ncbi:BrnT family toxin [Fluviispira sanaruensis]|uniref:BrnT family toxin n=1 Tax=Fluviispira sanaruensis TaxID=2493639 RepID=A0A4P2VPY8_FLUSA|nr:BrnT family toxin [Fluviispira sanaruensis]BBH54370.1 BrnT family toxin [Fluviispira sanaruensis]
MQIASDKEVETWLTNVWNGEFDWDEGNTQKTSKHGVTPEQIETIIQNEMVFLGRIVEPDGVNFGENRYILLGIILDGRGFTLICTIRTEKVRPISCRRMRDNEKRAYEKAKKLQLR